MSKDILKLKIHAVLDYLDESQALLKWNSSFTEETGQVEDKRRCGRPRKLTKGDEIYLKINSLQDRKKSSIAIAADLAHSTGRQVHPFTVRRALILNGLHGRVAKQNQLLRKANKTKRLMFTQKHNNWSPIQLEKELWSDESKFEIFWDKETSVREEKREELKECCLQPTIKHGGGSTQIWGCISAQGVGDLVRFHGIMTAQ